MSIEAFDERTTHRRRFKALRAASSARSKTRPAPDPHARARENFQETLSRRACKLFVPRAESFWQSPPDSLRRRHSFSLVDARVYTLHTRARRTRALLRLMLPWEAAGALFLAKSGATLRFFSRSGTAGIWENWFVVRCQFFVRLCFFFFYFSGLSPAMMVYA